MICYSEEELAKVFQSETFLSNYNEYKKENTNMMNLKKFIDSIHLNKKYFRLELNKKRGYKKKYKNQNISDDTVSIKEINSLLNKLTDKNILSIREKIKQRLVHKEYLTELIIENILEKCIVHTSYIELYLELIHYLYSKDKIIHDMIYRLSDKIYQSIISKKITEVSDYLIMCEKNKKLDKLIGHSILITELEKKEIVKDKIHSTLNNFIDILSNCEEDEEKYKCVQCLYNIFKSYYGEYLLPEGYNQKLKQLIESEKSMKIKFKMMDILERK